MLTLGTASIRPVFWGIDYDLINALAQATDGFQRSVACDQLDGLNQCVNQNICNQERRQSQERYLFQESARYPLRSPRRTWLSFILLHMNVQPRVGKY